MQSKYPGRHCTGSTAVMATTQSVRRSLAGRGISEAWGRHQPPASSRLHRGDSARLRFYLAATDDAVMLPGPSDASPRKTFFFVIYEPFVQTIIHLQTTNWHTGARDGSSRSLIRLSDDPEIWRTSIGISQTRRTDVAEFRRWHRS